MRFQGDVVLISGGSRGIGKATATAFSKEGATVVLNYQKNTTAAEESLAGLNGSGHIVFQADLASPEQVEHMVSSVVSEFGKIDVLVNNAGIHEPHPIDRVDYANWQRIWQETLSVNLVGAANLTYCVVQQMILRRAGRIVMVSSRGAFRGEPDQPAYGASKAGMNALGQSLAQKLAPHGITVGIVAPGFVATDLAKHILDGPQGPDIRAQSPYQRVAKPEEVAHAILFLADKKSLFSTGTIIDVNGASYLRS